MSTKIYNGFKINVPMHKVLPLLMEFHKSLEQSEWYERQVFLSNIYYATDAVVGMFNLPIDRQKLLRDMCRIWEEHYKYEIAIIPGENYTLAIVFSDDRELLSRFESLPQVQEWAYWDNTDPPEDVSEEEWELRREDWECLEYGMPVCRGALIWSPFTEYDFPFIGSLADPSYDPETIRWNVARYLKDELKLDVPIRKLRWKIPLLTKERIFSRYKLVWRLEWQTV